MGFAVARAAREAGAEVTLVAGPVALATPRGVSRIDVQSAREMLQATLAQVKTLNGLLPICACCKKIRDDKGYWTQVEVYVHERSEAEFTHGICPECAKAYREKLKI